MPTTTAVRPAPDMTHVWAGRRKQAADDRLAKAVAEARKQGYTVILIGPDGKTRTYS
jgi:sarcosine oxidase gamma subunit